VNTPSARRVVLYARISVSKEESVSVERQIEAGRKLAEARGWDVVGEFVDDGVSASANRPEDRKGWKALMRTAAFDAVIIWKVDRLARRVLDFLHVDEALQARGAGLVAVEDPIDMTSPMGRAFATLLAVFGEMEAEAIRSRIKAMRAHLSQGYRFVGGGIPYGYRSTDNPDGPGRVLVQDPERIEWLRQMVRLGQEGQTVNAIAVWLTRHDAPIPLRNKERMDPGNRVWNRQTVEQLLRNPVLAGMFPHNPGRAKGAKRTDSFAVRRHPDGEPMIVPELAILTYEEFEQLQRTLDARDTPQSRKGTERQLTSVLLSKVAICDDCDVHLYRGTNQKQPVLYCPKCRQTISRTHLDAYLIGRLLTERGEQPYGTTTVADSWDRAHRDDETRREILLSQLEILRVRRGVAGRRFDSDRVLLQWRPTHDVTLEVAA
jgi:DNA invertase Pin-like site-specific DNA recombinase